MREGRLQRLSVFKGREAKLNRVIFQTLALNGPQTIYDIHKQTRTLRGLKLVKYSSINKRVRSLAESGYVKKVGIKRTKAGFEAFNYDVSYKALLAILINALQLDSMITRMDDSSALVILGCVLHLTL